MILSQKNIEEIAVAVIRDFQKSFFGSEADDPARFALPTPIDPVSYTHLWWNCLREHTSRLSCWLYFL